VSDPESPERALRARLSIPLDAARVLVFTESSHWDTNWLRTSEEYFEQRLKPIFAGILEALERDPLRVYCVESVFFLRLYWERHPEHRARLRALIDNRQLRIVSSSYTTPDTLLPHAEAIFRDFHLGQEWLRAAGLDVAPRTAYFPDNFGHSPHLPSLMRAVGVDSVSVTRIDGMHFVAADYRPKSAFPLRGSTAELLQKELRTLDFVWRADDGEEVLAHWNAFTYFHGDMLAHAGIIRWNGVSAAIPWRTRGHIARRIDGFVRQLEPLSRTPYLLVPIGMDFNEPIADLRALLERYNRERYPVTGTYAVLAGLDDYFDLVGTRRADLPVLSVDPNPYWMGFYATRPEIKQRPARIARSLVLAEKLSAGLPPHPAIDDAIRKAWHSLVLINHHDAITGTSPDRIWNEEQKPWLDAAESAVNNALSLASAGLPRRTEAARPRDGAGIRVWRVGTVVHVATANYTLALNKSHGGCLTSFIINGEEVLGGVGFDLVAFADEGGLWRLGHEYRGGRFHEIDRASQRPARIKVIEREGEVVVRVTSLVGGTTFVRTVTCREDAPFPTLHVAGEAGRRVTVTARWETRLEAPSLTMDTVGGHIERPHERHYKPTFWPVPSVVSLRTASSALHVGFEAPTAVAFTPPGTLEWIVARNAVKERAFFGLLPVLAHPIGGTGDEHQTHDAAMFVTSADASIATVRRSLERIWFSSDHRSLDHHADLLVQCDDPAVSILAAKRADVGAGIIVRLASDSLEPRVSHLWLQSNAISTATRCDAREQHLEPLEIVEGRARVPIERRITTVRLIPRE